MVVHMTGLALLAAEPYILLRGGGGLHGCTMCGMGLDLRCVIIPFTKRVRKLSTNLVQPIKYYIYRTFKVHECGVINKKRHQH